VAGSFRRVYLSNKERLSSAANYQLKYLVISKIMPTFAPDFKIERLTFVEEFGCLQPHKKMLKLQNPKRFYGHLAFFHFKKNWKNELFVFIRISF
jgi:hypothetical protein